VGRRFVATQVSAWFFVDFFSSHKFQQLPVESPEAQPVIELAKMSEFVTQSIDEAGVA
jgi:hypothetical protein